MSSTRARARAALAASALLLLGLTGCGSDAQPTTAAAAPTAEVVAEKDAFIAGLVSAIKTQTSAEARLTFGTAVTADAAFSYGGTSPEARITAKLFGQSIEVILVGGDFYLKKSAGEKFVKLSADDPSLSLFGGFSDVDPQAALTGIAEAITSVREVGPRTVDGQELTQYAVAVDGKALGSGMLGSVPGVDLSQDLVIDLYVDAENLIHRAEADLGENDLTLVVTNWGEPVTITAPAAAEILQN